MYFYILNAGNLHYYYAEMYLFVIYVKRKNTRLMFLRLQINQLFGCHDVTVPA